MGLPFLMARKLITVALAGHMQVESILILPSTRPDDAT